MYLDSLSSLLSTGAGILKRLLGESKYRGGHSQETHLVSLSTGAGMYSETHQVVS